MAAIVGLVMVAIYLALVVLEGNNHFAEVALWAIAMFVAATLSMLAMISQSDKRARRLLLFSATLSLAIGAVSIFSLGVGFLAAGATALYAANHMTRSTEQPLHNRHYAL